MIKVCEMCGKSYERIHGHQKYCCQECAKKANRIKEGKRRKKARLIEKERMRKSKGIRMPSIMVMMQLANELTEKTGMDHQYGDVQKMFLTGKLKVKDGAIV